MIDLSLIHVVNLDSLLCEDQTILDQKLEDNSNTVCATNGVTYPSLCRLLQDTGNEAVAYVGECDREDCDGGPVSTYYFFILI